MVLAPFTYCGYCGAAFTTSDWPRGCAACGSTTYRNPLPVSVALVPIAGGLLTVRRAIEPRKGLLALPGGFISWGEGWQQAAARELHEETGLQITAESFRDYATRSAPDGTLLIFGLAPAQPASALESWSGDGEASELVVLQAPVELAFPLHTAVVADWFAAQRAAMEEQE